MSAPIEVTIPSTVEACFEPGSDADRFRIVASSDGPTHITIELRSLRGGTSAFMYLHDADGQRLANAHGPAMAHAGRASTLDLLARPGETFLLHAYPNTYPRDEAARYAFDIRQRPLTDPGEPNDTPDAATALALGTEHASALTPHYDAKDALVDDVDHYRVEATKAGTLRVTVAFSETKHISPQVRILDGSGKALATGKHDAEAKVATGSYVVEIRRSHGIRPFRGYVDRAGEINAYRVRATVE